MGSISEAVLTGFICRLCAKANKVVVQVLTDRVLTRQIAETVEIKILSNDKLPKTVCLTCIEAVVKNHNFIQMIRRNHNYKNKRRKIEPQATRQI